MTSMKRNVISFSICIVVSIAAVLYAEYWKNHYGLWYEIDSYRDESFLRVSLLEKYAEDCERDDFKRTEELLFMELEMYEELSRQVPNIPFVDGIMFRDEQLERISKIRAATLLAKRSLSDCDSI
jgi:hypothetical protein